MALLRFRNTPIPEVPPRVPRARRSAAPRPAAAPRSRSRLALLLVVCAAALGWGAPAAAKIYRCDGAGGAVTYTSSPESCRTGVGTEVELRHELPRGGGSTAERRPPPSPPPSPRLRSGYEEGEGAAAIWRRKKEQAEADLRMAEDLAPRYQRATIRCRRSGGDAWYEDADGIKHPISCQRLDQEYQRLTAEQDRLRAYLNGGLAEECRRAGCLPGWIR